MARNAIEKLIERLQEIPDPRRQCRNLRHALVDVLTISFCAVLSGCEDFFEFELFAKSKESFFRQFLALPNGTPSHDTFRRVLQAVEPMALQTSLVEWLREFRGLACEELRIVAIDGKTMRRTFNRSSGLGGLHLVSAWATELGVTLGQLAVDEKSNEITAIPELLNLLDVKGAMVTIDAAGCQKDIAGKIIEKQGDYLLALKGNQPTLHDAVSNYFLEQSEKRKVARGIRRQRSTERGHGRDTMREVWIAPVPVGMAGASDWSGLTSIVMVVCETTNHTTGEVHGETRYYITSAAPKVQTIAHAVRSHWSIENGLHWVLDVVFHEDQRRLLDRRAAENFAMLNRLAVSVLKADTSRKGSIKGKRKVAGWDDSFLIRLLVNNSV